MLERLELEKFTVFDKLSIDFSPGINVFIGKNGTGKTHILKVLYTVLSAFNEKIRVSDKIAGVFLPKDKSIGRLVKRKRGSSEAEVKIYKNKKLLSLGFSNHTKDTLKWYNGWKDLKIKSCVYIPVKEMLANAPGFLSLYKKRNIHFEEIYADIIYNAFLPSLKGRGTPARQNLLKMIQKVISGKIIIKNEQFFLKNKSGELEFTLLAEGMRKLGLLWLLIQNGTLLKGAKLFWDEPEANLNPSMLKTVVEILLELQKNGVQIFIATHNYVLLRQFDLLKSTKNKIRYFHLEMDDKTKKISCHGGDNYVDIIPNKITEAYTDIYNAEVERSLGGL